MAIPDNVQVIAAVNRGSEFSATFGIDPAQLDRFAPVQLDYMPPNEEAALLSQRHPELSPQLVATIVQIASQIRANPDFSTGLSVRATEEACIYLKHPLLENDRVRMLPEILKSSFCGRFAGRWNDPGSDAGTVWSMIREKLHDEAKLGDL